ncbi:MAG: DUF1365 family protein, partial [Patiriisocius sp.]
MTVNTPTTMESGIYTGNVFHKRSVPKVHKFNYRIYLFWLKLKEVETLENNVSGFSVNKTGLSVVNFKREDYLGDPSINLETAVLEKMNALSE